MTMLAFAIALKFGDALMLVNLIVLSSLAIFQDRLRALVWRPRLRVRASVAPPDSHKTLWNHYEDVWDEARGSNHRTTTKVPCYYLRILVENRGNTEARNVEVYAAALECRDEHGRYKRVARFTPMNLFWAHDHKVVMPLLSPYMAKYCDLGHILHPGARAAEGHVLPEVPPDKFILALDLQSEPEMKGHLVGPGAYRMEILVAGSNCPPHRFHLAFTLSGNWHDEEEVMLGRGVTLQVV